MTEASKQTEEKRGKHYFFTVKGEKNLGFGSLGKLPKPYQKERTI
jgi:hypothetical protein